MVNYCYEMPDTLVVRLAHGGPLDYPGERLFQHPVPDLTRYAA